MKRTSETSEFITWDGTSLFYRTWKPQAESKRAILLIHRGHEHSGRLQDLVDRLDLPDHWMFSWDNRGHGHSPGRRGFAPSYSALVRDLDSFARHLRETHGFRNQDFSIVANSVGAVTASAWVHDYAPGIRSMVLAAPAFRIRLYMPFAIPLLRLWRKLKPDAVIRSYVKAKMLTHDPEQSAAYDADELITRDISNHILIGLHDAASRVIRDAGVIHTPTLVLSAGSDWVVKNQAQRRFYQALGSSRKRMTAYPGFYHAILFETERDRPIAEAREFLLENEVDPGPPPNLLEADKGGATATEYDLLRQPATGLKRLYYGFQKKGTETIGALSDGVKVGLETGFDSGKSLDYVYDNESRGTTPLGRMIDRMYLDAVGWKGIRQRRVHIRELLTAAVEENLRTKGEVRILDVATGCGRYVLDVLESFRDKNVHALLRDFTRANLEQGRETARKLNLDHVVFEEGDAFDADSLASVDPRPQIAIVSGLYELFPENCGIRTSLAGIAKALEPGGILIYTCQPWHPQVELIARTLVNREGQPWIMRRRSQAEMDALVGSAGLEKGDQRIDEWGIFTVAVARKPEAP